MKKLLVICGLLFSVVTFAQAQDGQGKGQGGGRRMGNPEERTKLLAEKLNLSDDQKAKVTAIYVEQGAKMKKLRDSLGDDRQAWRGVMMKSNEAGEAKIEALLNDDQKKAFAAWKVERAEAMKKRAAERAAGQ
jgi:protein CpxP